MIKYYDPNGTGKHVVRVTFMEWDYVGHISFKVGGNCRGADLLGADFLDGCDEDAISRFTENDCQFSCDEDNGCFNAVLHNASGAELLVEWDFDSEEAKDRIVSLEFTEFNKEA